VDALQPVPAEYCKDRGSLVTSSRRFHLLPVRNFGIYMEFITFIFVVLLQFTYFYICIWFKYYRHRGR